LGNKRGQPMNNIKFSCFIAELWSILTNKS
jgi:hypothetical protein